MSMCTALGVEDAFTLLFKFKFSIFKKPKYMSVKNFTVKCKLQILKSGSAYNITLYSPQKDTWFRSFFMWDSWLLSNELKSQQMHRA